MEFGRTEARKPAEQHDHPAARRRSRLYKVATFLATGGYSLLESERERVDGPDDDPIVEAIATGGYSLLK